MKIRYIVLAISAITSSLLLLVIIASPVGGDWMGIAVTDNDQVYLGTNKSIFLIDITDAPKAIINNVNSHSYCLTVTDDILLMVTSGNLYKYSLDGEFLGKEKSDYVLSRQLENALFSPIESEKFDYQMNRILGFYYITRTDRITNETETLYQMPIDLYVFRLLMILSFTIFAVSVATVVFRGLRESYSYS